MSWNHWKAAPLTLLCAGALLAGCDDGSGGGGANNGGGGGTLNGGVSASRADAGDGCEPGSTWAEDCNTCTCDDDGFASCTEIGCGAGTADGGNSTSNVGGSNNVNGGAGNGGSSAGNGGTGEDAGTSVANAACQQPKVIGPCEAAFPAYWHNPETGSCEAFLYGGCEGNDNRFDTLAECESECDVKNPAPADGCEACLAGGGSWQPEADECTQDCAIQDISCFTDSCPGSCDDSCSDCFSSSACEAAGCQWNGEGEAMWCSAA